MRRFWRTGITEIRHAASRRSFVADLRRFVPELSAADVLPAPPESGRRRWAVTAGWSTTSSFTDGAGAARPQRPSPAATSSPRLRA